MDATSLTLIGAWFVTLPVVHVRRWIVAAWFAAIVLLSLTADLDTAGVIVRTLAFGFVVGAFTAPVVRIVGALL